MGSCQGRHAHTGPFIACPEYSGFREIYQRLFILLRIQETLRTGLGASVFTADIERGRKVAAKIESGMVFINQPVWTAAQLPFGGIKNSGFGRELSELGFGEFVNEKLINIAPSGSPPWGPVK
jgi:succinate-semialdehyde dehydrogenase / glutarate-semialdehyde dehydrogenase